MLRKRLNRQSIDTHNDQQELDEIFTSLNSLLELQSNLYDLQKQTLDPVIKKAYTDTKNEIISKVRLLYQRNISVVDLVKRYGSLLVKSQILQAQELVAKKENEQGELQLTDLVSEDQIIADRLAPLKQQGVELGYFTNKISQENLLKSKRLQEIAKVLARRETEGESQNKLLQAQFAFQQETESKIQEGEELKEPEPQVMQIEEVEPRTLAELREEIKALKEREIEQQEEIDEIKGRVVEKKKERSAKAISVLVKSNSDAKEKTELEQLQKEYDDLPADQKQVDDLSEEAKEILDKIELLTQNIVKRNDAIKKANEAKKELSLEIEARQKELRDAQGSLEQILQDQNGLKIKSEKVIESYRESRRKELVDIKIDTFTKDYDQRLRKNLKRYMDLYTPLVSQFKNDLIKSLKKEILKFGEDKFADGLEQALNAYEDPESDESEAEESKAEEFKAEKIDIDDDITSVAFYQIVDDPLKDLTKKVFEQKLPGKLKETPTTKQLQELVGKGKDINVESIRYELDVLIAKITFGELDEKESKKYGKPLIKELQNIVNRQALSLKIQNLRETGITKEEKEKGRKFLKPYKQAQAKK